jgi:DNA-binding NarL/FixJ family response regulator
MNSWDVPSELLERFSGVLSRSPVRRAIVLLLLEGCSRKQIALKLNRSQHTIDGHLKAIYREVGVGDRARLMLMASTLLQHGEPPLGFGEW